MPFRTIADPTHQTVLTHLNAAIASTVPYGVFAHTSASDYSASSSGASLPITQTIANSEISINGSSDGLTVPEAGVYNIDVRFSCSGGTSPFSPALFTVNVNGVSTGPYYTPMMGASVIRSIPAAGNLTINKADSNATIFPTSSGVIPPYVVSIYQLYPS